MHNQDRMIPGGEYRKINVMDTFAARELKEACPDSIWNSKEYLAYTLGKPVGTFEEKYLQNEDIME